MNLVGYFSDKPLDNVATPNALAGGSLANLFLRYRDHPTNLLGIERPFSGVKLVFEAPSNLTVTIVGRGGGEAPMSFEGRASCDKGFVSVSSVETVQREGGTNQSTKVLRFAKSPSGDLVVEERHDVSTSFGVPVYRGNVWYRFPEQRPTTHNLSLNSDASPAALTRRPLGAG